MCEQGQLRYLQHHLVRRSFLPLVAVTASGELRTKGTPFPASQPSRTCSRRASAALSAPVSSAHAQGRRAGATLCTPSSCAMTAANLRLQAAATQRTRRGERCPRCHRAIRWRSTRWYRSQPLNRTQWRRQRREYWLAMNRLLPRDTPIICSFAWSGSCVEWSLT